jgi:hypothetical protein
MILAAALAIGCGSPSGLGRDDWRAHPHSLPATMLPARAAVPCGPGDANAGQAPLEIAIPGPVKASHAPLPASEAERHTFAALYEPLVRVTCDGEVVGALADEWSAYHGGSVWRFRLRDGARFWNGEPVTPADVLASWRRAVALCRLRGEPSPFLRFDPRGDAVTVLDDDELLVSLRRATDTLPLDLAHPALAVVGRSDGQGWLAGSGPCRPDGAPRDELVRLLPVSGHPERPAWSALRIDLLAGERDARDLLDTDAHAVVTRDRSVRDYFASRRGIRVVDLPWDRRYFLVTMAEDPESRRRWSAGWDRSQLAREIGDYLAEPAEFHPYEPQLGPCLALRARVEILVQPPLPVSDARPSDDADLALWPAGDPDAGQLAERLASVAARPLRDEPLPGRGQLQRPPRPPLGSIPTALPVADATLTAHVQHARAGAIVLPWPRRFARPCDELARLLSLAEWLQTAALDGDAETAAVPPGARPSRFTDAAPPSAPLAASRRLERERLVQPLVQTRAAVASRPGVGGWTWQLDGTLQLWRLARQD